MSAKHTLSALTLALVAALVLAAAPLRAAGPTVELYVTSWCPYCSKAKAYFQAKGIAYTAYDIEKDPAAAKRFQQYGQRGVPLVVIGTTAIPGYSVGEYDKALAAAQTAPAHPKTDTAP